MFGTWEHVYFTLDIIEIEDTAMLWLFSTHCVCNDDRHYSCFGVYPGLNYYIMWFSHFRAKLMRGLATSCLQLCFSRVVSDQYVSLVNRRIANIVEGFTCFGFSLSSE